MLLLLPGIKRLIYSHETIYSHQIRGTKAGQPKELQSIKKTSRQPATLDPVRKPKWMN